MKPWWLVSRWPISSWGCCSLPTGNWVDQKVLTCSDHSGNTRDKLPMVHFWARKVEYGSTCWQMAVGQQYVPKMEPWQMDTWTKTCGPIPGGLILTHTQMDPRKFCRRDLLGARELQEHHPHQPADVLRHGLRASGSLRKALPAFGKPILCGTPYLLVRE